MSNSSIMTPQERFSYHLSELCRVCKEEEWGDPLNYNRAREIDLSIKLNHRISKTFSGADGYDENNEPVEYKSTIQKVIIGTYNGISVQPTWEEQEKYLREQKIGKYKKHYFTRYKGADIHECWVLTGDQVLEYIIPKLKDIYFNKKNNKKDPRLGISIPVDVIRSGEFVDI